MAFRVASYQKIQSCHHHVILVSKVTRLCVADGHGSRHWWSVINSNAIPAHLRPRVPVCRVALTFCGWSRGKQRADKVVPSILHSWTRTRKHDCSCVRGFWRHALRVSRTVSVDGCTTTGHEEPRDVTLSPVCQDGGQLHVAGDKVHIEIVQLVKSAP